MSVLSRSALPGPSLPRSALLCAWLEAVRAGHAGPDDLEETVHGTDPRHLVVGVGDEPLPLHRLTSVLQEPPRLALPVPGDPLGLGGPPPTNAAALEAGEAVIADGVAFVPQLDARTVVWHAHPADPVPWVDERETAIELRTALSEVTVRLVDLDVASWQPEIPDLLMNLRKRPPLPLPPGLGPRQVETVERAVLCLDIVRLALVGEGGSVSSHEMSQRRAALADLDRAARRALVGACSGRA